MSWYDIKDRGIMGSGGGEIKEVIILGRTLRWTKEGIEYEADAKHRKELMKRGGLDSDSKAAVSPAIREEKEDVEGGMVELEEWEWECGILEIPSILNCYYSLRMGAYTADAMVDERGGHL